MASNFIVKCQADINKIQASEDLWKALDEALVKESCVGNINTAIQLSRTKQLVCLDFDKPNLKLFNSMEYRQYKPLPKRLRSGEIKVKPGKRSDIKYILGYLQVDYVNKIRASYNQSQSKKGKGKRKRKRASTIINTNIVNMLNIPECMHQWSSCVYHATTELNQDRELICGYIDSVMVAYAILWDDDETLPDNHSSYLALFDVLTPYQRQGIGKRFMEGIVEERKVKGFKALTTIPLQHAVEFYNAVGFREISAISHTFVREFC